MYLFLYVGSGEYLFFLCGVGGALTYRKFRCWSWFVESGSWIESVGDGLWIRGP